MKFEIKSRWNGSVLFSFETDSLRLAVEAGVKSGADLTGADLTGADLRSADLRSAVLRSADLRSADLTGADLRSAVLRSADLRSAVLRSADLRSADLTGADLTDADLRSAVLRSAVLRSADLRSADLRSAVLTPIRDDLWAVLSSSPAEVPGLRQALLDGKIDGSAYQGECACLVGTLAKVRGCAYDSIPGLTPNGSRLIEQFFCAIKPGDTPENSQFSTLALEWTDEWLANMRAAFAVQS